MNIYKENYNVYFHISWLALRTKNEFRVLNIYLEKYIYAIPIIIGLYNAIKNFRKPRTKWNMP